MLHLVDRLQKEAKSTAAVGGWERRSGKRCRCRRMTRILVWDGPLSARWQAALIDPLSLEARGERGGARLGKQQPVRSGFTPMHLGGCI